LFVRGGREEGRGGIKKRGRRQRRLVRGGAESGDPATAAVGGGGARATQTHFCNILPDARYYILSHH